MPDSIIFAAFILLAFEVNDWRRRRRIKAARRRLDREARRARLNREFLAGIDDVSVLSEEPELAAYVAMTQQRVPPAELRARQATRPHGSVENVVPFRRDRGGVA